MTVNATCARPFEQVINKKPITRTWLSKVRCIPTANKISLLRWNTIITKINVSFTKVFNLLWTSFACQACKQNTITILVRCGKVGTKTTCGLRKCDRLWQLATDHWPMVTDSGSGHTSVGVKRIASNISVDAGLDCPSHGQNQAEKALYHTGASALIELTAETKRAFFFCCFKPIQAYPTQGKFPSPKMDHDVL